MNRQTCTICHRRIPAGEAVIRSVSFERVHYCRPCAVALGLFMPPIHERIEAPAVAR